MSTPETGVSQGVDHTAIVQRVIRGIQQHTDTADGARAMVKNAISSVPGLDAVLYPALREAQLEHAIPPTAGVAAESM